MLLQMSAKKQKKKFGLLGKLQQSKHGDDGPREISPAAKVQLSYPLLAHPSRQQIPLDRNEMRDAFPAGWLGALER